MDFRAKLRISPAAASCPVNSRYWILDAGWLEISVQRSADRRTADSVQRLGVQLEKNLKKGISAFDIPSKFAKIRGFRRFYGVRMKTFLMKAEDVQAQRKWWLINADGLVLGRMSTRIARILMGKNRPTYTPYVDGGDCVVVVNAEKVRVTGAKAEQREYDYYHALSGRTQIHDVRGYVRSQAGKGD